MKVIKAPAPLDITKDEFCIFLAGSIEMGEADDWQARIVKYFDDEVITFLNPRRDDWDKSWHQDSENFIKQVNWELDALERANKILMYFDPFTKSPISLLELGLFARSGKISVICPKGFWRRGNVEIVCKRFGVPLYNSFDDYRELKEVK
jgi:hypothetical protein